MEYQELFQLAVEEAPIHIIITDTDGNIMYANRAAEDLTGYSKEEMIDNTPALWGKQMSKSFYQDMWETIKFKREVFRGDIINKRKNGSKYYSRLIVRPVVSNGAKLIGFIGIEKDITEFEKIKEKKDLIKRLMENYKHKKGLL